MRTAVRVSDKGLGWEICVLIGVILFLVMVVLVSIAPPKGGALRRSCVGLGHRRLGRVRGLQEEIEKSR